MEEIQFRHANRLAGLEKRVLELRTTDTAQSRCRRIYTHEADQILSELVDRVDEMDSRIDEPLVSCSCGCNATIKDRGAGAPCITGD